jgi:hypothetical protein
MSISFPASRTLAQGQFTADFFTDKDVFSTVLEVPNSALGTKEIGLSLGSDTARRDR